MFNIVQMAPCVQVLKWEMQSCDKRVCFSLS